LAVTGFTSACYAILMAQNIGNKWGEHQITDSK
jgi:hypothetical protein